MTSTSRSAKRALLLGGAFLALASAAISAAGAARAQTPPDEPASGTKLELSGTGTVDAQPDLLTAVLVARASSGDAATAQARTNDAVKKAMATAGSAKDVKAAAGGYSVSEERNGDAIKGWEARQTIRLSSGDASQLLSLVGHLQSQGLLLDGLNWSLSSDHQKTLTKEATKRALAEVQARAEDAATDLHMRVVSYSEINLETPFSPRPVMMMARIASAPTATPEDQTVTVTARAVVRLAR